MLAIFKNFGSNQKLNTEKADLEKEVKVLKSRVESRDETIKITRREQEDRDYRTTRDHTRERESAGFNLSQEKERGETKVTELNRGHKNEMDELAAEHSTESMRMETAVEDLEGRLDMVESETTEKVASEVKIKVAVARGEIREEFVKEVDSLKTDVKDALVTAAASTAEAEEKGVVVSSLQGQLKDYREFVQFAMEKLPNVDLSKFNINVDIPSPEVTVVSAAGGGSKKK